uniref:Uncharacterized protein n=1 Tax=Zea mays TaxID=4577 RepID=A0A804PDJ4_MAIZE
MGISLWILGRKAESSKAENYFMAKRASITAWPNLPCAPITSVLNERTKYNNMEPDAVDFFGECMNSPRNGRTPLANEIYEQMVAEKERELEEGEAQKSPSKLNRPHLKKTKVCCARPKRK